MRSLTCFVGAGILVILSGTAQALAVRVDWTASVFPNAVGTPSLGSGLLAGSLGTFEVSAAGDVFDLPADGSLSIVASGFFGGFANQTYSLTRRSTFPLQLEFLSVGSDAEDFSVKFVDIGAVILSEFGTPSCLVGGTSGDCSVTLFDDIGDDFGEDGASARWNAVGVLPLESSGAVDFTFTVVPEPSAAILSAVSLLPLVWLRARQRHSN